MFQCSNCPSPRLEALEPDPTQQGLAESFVATAERLEKNLCDLVSRGVLTCGLTELKC